MRIECVHGYFKFFETRAGEISQFMTMSAFEIVRSGDHFTFADLVEAPHYSLAGGKFLGAPTSKTFAGRPWEVMRMNGLVYNFVVGAVMPIELITQPVKLSNAGHYLISTGMILPGSVRDDGSRVKDYSAQFIHDLAHFRYSEVGS